MIRLIDVKLIMKRAVFRLPDTSWIIPVNSGPKDVPNDVIIMVNANATASSRGRIQGR